MCKKQKCCENFPSWLWMTVRQPLLLKYFIFKSLLYCAKESKGNLLRWVAKMSGIIVSRSKIKNRIIFFPSFKQVLVDQRGLNITLWCRFVYCWRKKELWCWSIVTWDHQMSLRFQCADLMIKQGAGEKILDIVPNMKRWTLSCHGDKRRFQLPTSVLGCSVQSIAAADLLELPFRFI